MKMQKYINFVYYTISKGFLCLEKKNFFVYVDFGNFAGYE